MITLNRLGHTDAPFQLNPDLIVTIESTPDTVISLATTAKIVVAETPEQVAAAVRAYRIGMMSEALSGGRPQRKSSPPPPRRQESARLSAVDGAGSGGAPVHPGT